MGNILKNSADYLSSIDSQDVETSNNSNHGENKENISGEDVGAGAQTKAAVEVKYEERFHAILLRNVIHAQQKLQEFLQDAVHKSIHIETLQVMIPNRFVYATFLIFWNGANNNDPDDRNMINKNPYTPIICVCDDRTDPDFIIEQAILNLEQIASYKGFSLNIDLFQEWVNFTE